MIITNNQNLPEPFIQYLKSDYQFKSKQYSVTSLLRGVRETILKRRYYDKIKIDASEMIWLLFGTAVHSILEQTPETNNLLKEEYLKINIKDGYKLSGKLDLYNKKSKTITDYKTTSVYKVLNNDYKDWKQQLLIYAYMLKQNGLEVKMGSIVTILKDHSKTKAKFDKKYPNLPVVKVNFIFNAIDYRKIEKFIFNKFDEIIKAEQLLDEELPLCTSEERWNVGSKYAVMAKGKKRAKRVLNSLEEAENYLIENLLTSETHYIEERIGEDKKCENYCLVKKFCSYYQHFNKIKHKGEYNE